MTDEFNQLIDSLLRTDAPSDSAANDLITVRALALRDARRPRGDSGAVVELAPDVRAAFGRAADPQVRLPGGIAAPIERRDLVLHRRTALDEADSVGALWTSFGGLRAARRFGPFLEDGLGPVWYDLVFPAVRTRILFGADPRPVLLFTSARLAHSPITGRFRVTGRQGTVWVRADLLVPAAGSGDYAGFTVRRSVFEAGAQPSTASDGLIAFAARPVRASLRLDFADAPVPENGRCGDSDVTAPASLVLTWTGPNVGVRLDGGRADGPNGLELEFSQSTEVRIDGRRVWFPAVVSPMTMPVDALSNDHATFEGTVALAQSGWSLPLIAAGDPALLPDAGDGGGWLLRLDGAFAGTWFAVTQSAHTHDAVRLLLGKGRYELSGTSRRPADDEGVHAFGLWPVDPSLKPLPFQVNIDAVTTFAAGCHADLGPYLRYEAATAPRFDKPIDARARPLTMARAPVHVLLHGSPGNVSLAVVPRGPDLAWSSPDTPTSLVLENAYLAVVSTAFAGLTGTLGTGRRVLKGSASIALRLGAWVPTLPDPYVSNVAVPRELFASQGNMRVVAVLAWDSGSPSLRFRGTLEKTGATLRDASKPLSRPAPRGDSSTTEPGLVAAGGQTAHSGTPDARAAALRQQEAAFRHGLRSEWEGDGFRIDPPERRGGAMLLDVSTRRHQIGVAIGPRRGGRPEVPPGALPRFVLDGLAVKMPVAAVDVFALPQVQWEPVYTLDKDQNPELGWFPTPLAAPHDGGPTRITSRAQTLVPVIPDLVLEEAVVQFRDAREAIAIATTLPFGIVAVLQLAPSNDLGRRRDTAAFVRPVFPTKPSLEGALQLSVAAEGGRRRRGEEAPSFEGSTRQLLNGVDLRTGVPFGVSVLGATENPSQSVERFFNTEFATGNPRVPLTRYDISGYGASTFSDWNNPNAAFGDASKVQFSIIVGRTAFEVVKINTKLYPWGVSVTRSVTIERRGGGGVIRRDSGWQPTSDGLFDFRNGSVPSPYTFEPGLIEGVFEVRNIRSTKAPDVPLPDGGFVAPMYIDAKVQVAGAAGRATALGVLAFLHLRHRTPPVNPGQPITVVDLATLIERHGNCVGGPVEATLDVGGSGFRCRATGIEVGVSRGAGTPIFVGAVRVAPVFPPVGSWDAVRGPAPGRPPADMIAVTDGVPVLRSGRIGPPVNNAVVFAGPRGPIAFADTSDLHAGTAPANDYGFLQATPTHRFLFRRPFIEAGVGELRSNLPPAVADILAAATSKGFFPPLESAIQLTDRPYKLQVLAGTGRLRLEPPVIMRSPRPDLLVSADGTSEMRLDYSDATLAFELDDVTWRFELPGLVARCDGLGITNICELSLGLIGGTTIRPQMRNVRGSLFRDLEELLSVIPGFGSRPAIGDIDLAATNLDLATKVTARLKHEEPFGADPVWGAVTLMGELSAAIEAKHVSGREAGGMVIAGAALPIPAATAGTVIDSGVDSTSLGFLVGFGLQVKIMVKPPIFITVGGEAEVGYEVKFEKDKVESEAQSATGAGIQAKVTVYLGVGVGKQILAFKADAWLAAGFRIIAEGSDRGIGGVLLFEAELNLTIVTAGVSAEFAVLHITKADGSQAMKYAGELAISVKVAWIFYIEFSAELSEEDPISEEDEI